jgi:hypothetical protein
MASIALRNIRCIDYLAYVSIFTRATFRPKIKLDVFFSARKAVDARREVVGPLRRGGEDFLWDHDYSKCTIGTLLIEAEGIQGAGPQILLGGGWLPRVT